MSDSLLPPSASAQERSIEGATARISNVPVSAIRDAWDPVNCPSSLLPWLAWQFSVDQWDPTWTDDVKRTVIAAAVNDHRHKGTVSAIRSVFASIGFGDIEIDEGRAGKLHDGSIRHDGFALYGDPTAWAYYRVRLSKTLSNAQADQARALLATYAPARCHLFAIDFTDAALIHNGVATHDGSFSYGVA